MSLACRAFRQIFHSTATQNLITRGQIQNSCKSICSKIDMSQPINYKVEHDVKNSEFYINIGDERALLQYELKGNVYNLTHTFTPPALRGSGIAKVLAHRVFDHVADSGAKMVLTCSYLEHLNNKEQNPKYQPYIVDS